MTRTSWKHPPSSFHGAIEACLAHAQKHRRTIDHIAADMGLPNTWTLYKWIGNGRIPGVLIRPFELACRADYITRFLTHSAHGLFIPVPSGRLADAGDLTKLQGVTNEAVGALINFAAGKADAGAVIAAVTAAMEHLAFHRENVARAHQPELPLCELMED